jgi:hypothetical protein
MAIRTCESAHCSGADAEINEICKIAGWPVNHPVLTRDSKGPCTCSCSCLAHGTPVQLAEGSFKAIETIAVGESVLAAGKNLDWRAKEVVFSQGTTGVSRQKYTVLVTYGETALAVTSDHLFLLSGGKLKSADRLIVGDELVSPEGKPVPILSVHIGDYTAGFHHIATSKEKPSESLDGHLLNTNGVVSADYTLQLFYRTGQLDAQLIPQHASKPIVGSPQYVKEYGGASLRAPASVQRTNVRFAAHNALDQSDTFVPAEQTVLNIPPHACRFISDADAKARAGMPKRAFNDPLSREWTESLINHFRTFYPNVSYHLDWADDTVNAFAWVENGVRHVALKGGLVRDAALELEGIGVVLAHELAHHFGGAPTFPGGLSCEGQADYKGVALIMRVVWFGSQFIEQADAGIEQMAAFFGVPNDPTVPGGSAGCNHPPGRCRIATYHAAVNLGGKPACAG